MSAGMEVKTIKPSRIDNCDRRLMLFDLALGGHHGNYIKYSIDYWCEHELPGSLDIVVVPEFDRFHQNVRETIAKFQHPKIKLIKITDAQKQALNSRNSALDRLTRNLKEWELYCHYAKSRQATHSLLMYLDTCEIPLALGKDSPCPFSGIYFRPTFHYSNFPNYHPDWKDRLQKIREKLTWWRTLSHPQLHNIFCLDPFAVKNFTGSLYRDKVTYLPDPVEVEQFTYQNGQLNKANLGIESARIVFLLFGALDKRKGIYQLLDGIAKLPASLCQKLCLLIVGKTNITEQANIKQKLKRIVNSKPIQIIEKYEFITESEVASYFKLADVVLAPYQKHVGMSGILLLAAAAGKPVLSSNYGLMGEMVRQHGLGLTIDSSIPQEIAWGLTEYLTKAQTRFSDSTKMQAFAIHNSANNYVKTIFENIQY